MPTQAVEEYLESIYKMEKRGLPVIGARLAEELGVSPPTVTEMLTRLCSKGYVDKDPGSGTVLTESGKAAAEVLIRRHRLSERLLTDVLGFSWSRAHDEACRLEHAISAEVEEGLIKALKNPSTCPHGNPIPGVEAEVVRSVRLNEARVGSRGNVVCIEAEEEELLAYVQQLGLVPGAMVEVNDFAPFGGPVELTVDGGRIFVGVPVAERVLIGIVEDD